MTYQAVSEGHEPYGVPATPGNRHVDPSKKSSAPPSRYSLGNDTTTLRNTECRGPAASSIEMWQNHHGYSHQRSCCFSSIGNEYRDRSQGVNNRPGAGE